MKQTAILINPVQAHQVLAGIIWPFVKGWLIGNGTKLRVDVRPETRSTAQNARMWAMLTDISEQVIWHGRRLTSKEWKHVFSAALKKQDVVPGLEGGFVVLGQSTSSMSVREMAELQELMEAFGAERGVQFRAPESWGGR